MNAVNSNRSSKALSGFAECFLTFALMAAVVAAVAQGAAAIGGV